MEPEDRLKTYIAMGEVSRKWVSVMDTKAAFLSALNGALLGFIWTGAKFVEAEDWPKWLALGASLCSLISLLSALWTVIPRGSLSKTFCRHSRYANGFKAISFYGYVASHYPQGEESTFFKDVDAMDEATLAREALEQHYTISHSIQKKSDWVTLSGWLLMAALILTGAALIAKVMS